MARTGLIRKSGQAKRLRKERAEANERARAESVSYFRRMTKLGDEINVDSIRDTPLDEIIRNGGGLYCRGPSAFVWTASLETSTHVEKSFEVAKRNLMKAYRELRTLKGIMKGAKYE